MSLKLFYDLMSQPSRALFIYFNVAKIPFESCLVNLKQGEHLSDDFKEKNRFQKVPFIHDGGFKLSESIAIVRYINEKLNLNNHWYPKELAQRAAVDEYLEWQHHNTRLFCALYFQKKWLFPLLTGKPPNPKTIEKLTEQVNDCLDKIENLWLGKQKYLCGDEISVADLFAACELEQTRMAGFEPRKDRPILSAWLERVKQQTNPYYDQAHNIVYKIEKMGSKAKL